MTLLQAPQREIREALARHSLALADLYVSAVTLIRDPAFPARLRLLSHAVREIRNRLPDAIGGPKKAPGRIDQNFLDELARKWRRFGIPSEPLVATTLPGGSVPVVSIPRPVAKMFVELIERHIASRQTKPESARRLFEACAGNPGGSFPVTVDQWLKVTEWFVQQTHESEGARSEVSEPDLQRQFDVFETMLGALLREFFASTSDLDAILKDANG